ncbi:MAG: ribose-phosphate pyrophosphokinase [Metamycoplasmataceae bacterium]
MKEIKIFGMPNSEILTKRVADYLKIPVSEIYQINFSDGEMMLKPSETVRNKSVYIICNTSKNDSILQLLIFIDAVKRASAKKITIVNSYYGYSRQDRKANKREPITAKLIANLIETAGANKLISVDLHNPSIQGFFNIPVDDLKWTYMLANYLKKEEMKCTVVSPDHGGAVRARILAELLSNNIQIAIVDKRRTNPNKSEILNVLGDVNGKNVVIIDDIIDTGGTILKAAERLKKDGAKKVYIAATHGLFSKSFKEFNDAKYIDKILLSDSIYNEELIKNPKVEIISLAPLLADVIRVSEESKSISEIYKKYKNDKL